MADKEILFKPVSKWAGGGDENTVYYKNRYWPVATSEQLSLARKELQRLVNLDFMEQGVDILDIESVFIHPDTKIGEDTVLLPNVIIREDVEIGRGCQIGPFAYIRPGTTLEDGCKIGDFVELKNSSIGSGTKVNHLTYVGDSDVGKHVNFGCGTVTVNYDGSKKHRTVIGDNAFIGCNTNLVAPVSVGDNAYTAAGSTIHMDVPSDALAIARNRQENKDGWVKKRK